MIACGIYHTIIQNEKNETYICGWDDHLKLNWGDIECRDKFEKVNFDSSKTKNIACGGHHIIIQNVKNEIYVFGHNTCGQLGLGDYDERKQFKKVEYDFGEIKNIACGAYHTIIQNEKNEIYVCGGNSDGQLGLGDNKSRNKFEKVECNFGEIKNIACGGFHTVIQNEKNEIYVCGCNSHGQLGLGDNEGRNRFEKVEYDFGEVKKIACGDVYTVIQNGKNEIYVCGSNYNGGLGLGDNDDRNKFEKVVQKFGEIKKIACGGFHIIIQNEKNEIYACGYNGSGPLGLGDYKNRNKFEKVDYDFGEIKNTACGYNCTIIQNKKNEIYASGYNGRGHGQLGLGDNMNRNKFKKVNTDDIFEKIYNFELRLNTEEITL